MELQNSVVVITGAAMRVGREVALYLSERGANIIFSFYLDSEPWQETKTAIETNGGQCLAMQVEVRDEQQVQNLMDAAVEQFGRIDVLINNASVWLKTPFMDIKSSEWDLSMDINLKGPFLCSQAAARHMLAQGRGVIINITDLSAFQVWPGYAHHAASKAGLVALTKSMAAELAPAVRVNAIAPGTVLLPPNASPEKVQWAVDKSLLKKVGTPQDVGMMAAFLIENDFATGSVYFIDGGRSLV
jgi:NAD(P)-dependent dehydrogenase (short-subunit alcohol dehydrogenase family)